MAGTQKPVREQKGVTTQRMSRDLSKYAKNAGERQELSLYSFRSRGAIARALAGDSTESIMQQAYWNNPKTAWRYMRLMEVVSPGSAEGMVHGVMEEQFRELNEFSLSEQSRHPAAFSMSRMLKQRYTREEKREAYARARMIVWDKEYGQSGKHQQWEVMPQN